MVFYGLFLSPDTNLPKVFNNLRFDPVENGLTYVQVNTTSKYPAHILVLSEHGSKTKQLIKDQLATIGYTDSFDLHVVYLPT